MIITISGNGGSGKTTAAKKLKELFSSERVYVGGIRRELAREKGMSLAELNEYAMEHPETDVEVDEKAAAHVRELAKNNSVVVEGRTQFKFLPESIKLLLKVDVEEGARRVWKEIHNPEAREKRNEGEVVPFEEFLEKVKERENSDSYRYKKYYDIDHMDESHYDLVIDTTNLNPDEVIQKIIDHVSKSS